MQVFHSLSRNQWLPGDAGTTASFFRSPEGSSRLGSEGPGSVGGTWDANRS